MSLRELILDWRWLFHWRVGRLIVRRRLRRWFVVGWGLLDRGQMEFCHVSPAPFACEGIAATEGIEREAVPLGVCHRFPTFSIEDYGQDNTDSRELDSAARRFS